MTTKYLFELSRDKIIKSEEPLDLARSFQTDLTYEQFLGVLFMSTASNDLTLGPVNESFLRIYQWDLHTAQWERTRFMPFIHLPEWMGTIEDVRPQDLFEEVKKLEGNQGKHLKRYVFLLEGHEENEFDVYTSDSLEVLQGMISAAAWLGEDWRDYVHNIYENGVEMQV